MYISFRNADRHELKVQGYLKTEGSSLGRLVHTSRPAGPPARYKPPVYANQPRDAMASND